MPVVAGCYVGCHVNPRLSLWFAGCYVGCHVNQQLSLWFAGCYVGCHVNPRLSLWFAGCYVGCYGPCDDHQRPLLLVKVRLLSIVATTAVHPVW